MNFEISREDERKRSSKLRNNYCRLFLDVPVHVPSKLCETIQSTKLMYIYSRASNNMCGVRFPSSLSSLFAFCNVYLPETLLIIILRYNWQLREHANLADTFRMKKVVVVLSICLPYVSWSWGNYPCAQGSKLIIHQSKSMFVLFAVPGLISEVRVLRVDL